VPAGSIVFAERCPDPDHDRPIPYRGILERELFRQAFLIYCREEYGAVTRDAILGEQPPRGAKSVSVQFNLTGNVRDDSPILTVAVGPEHRVVWEENFSFARDEPYAGRAELALARWKKELAPMLERYVTKGKPTQTGKDVPLPEGAARNLQPMNFVAQYAAVREIHQTIRDKGESPQLLGGLVRGYANLGVLTECQMNAAHKVFKARALLYGHRLVERYPSAEGWWHLAYAQALTGLHGEALGSLASAQKIQPQPAVPGWAKLIEPFCRFDSEALLKEAEDRDHGPLARLLHYFAVEDMLSASNLTARVGGELLENDPGCFRIHDAMCSIMGVSHQHGATVGGLNAFSAHFPRQLKGLDNLPGKVKDLLGDDAEAQDVFQALIDAGHAEDAELNWAVLGQLAREAQFVLLFRRLDFMVHMWGVPVDDVLPAAVRLTQGHPYQPVIKALGMPRPLAANAIANVKFRDFDHAQGDLLRPVMLTNQTTYSILSSWSSNRLDGVYRDLMLRFYGYSMASNKMDFVKKGLKVSPEAPAVMTMLLLSDEPVTEEKLAEVEKRFPQNPAVCRALGERYLKGKQYAKAEGVLRRYAQLSPDKEAYDLLARCYREQGQEDKWLATLEEFLKTEPETLKHSRTRHEIADHFMNLKRYRDALPYAEGAAESYAGWAMIQAAHCNEALGDWDRAETWLRRLAGRYPTGPALWYLWCVRTGKGDRQAARKLAMGPDGAGGPGLDTQIMVKTVEGDLKGAAEALELLNQTTSSDIYQMMLVLTYDDLGKTEERDQLLQKMSALSVAKSFVDELARLFKATLAKGEMGELDLKVADGAVKRFESDPDQFGRFNYLLGRFLLRRGDTKNARVYLERCAALRQGTEAFRACAAVLLQSVKE
jgi:uncharacterized protein HemY